MTADFSGDLTSRPSPAGVTDAAPVLRHQFTRTVTATPTPASRTHVHTAHYTPRQPAYPPTLHTLHNQAVVERRLRPRCCHLESYFKRTSFSCRYICRDIMFAHKYSTRPLRPSRPRLQEVVPSVRCLQRVFLRAKPIAVCEPNCLSLAAASSSLNPCAHIRRHPKTGNT